MTQQPPPQMSAERRVGAPTEAFRPAVERT